MSSIFVEVGRFETNKDFEICSLLTSIFTTYQRVFTWIS